MQLVPYSGSNTQSKIPLTSDELNKLYSMNQYTNQPMFAQTTFGFSNITNPSGNILPNQTNLGTSSYGPTSTYLPQTQTMLYQFPYQQPSIERPLIGTSNPTYGQQQIPLQKPSSTLANPIEVQPKPCQTAILPTAQQSNPFSTIPSTNEETSIVHVRIVYHT